MTALAATCLVTLIVFNADSVRASSWHYGQEETWPQLCKEGRKQSPIALTDEIAHEREFSALIFENYEGEFGAHLKNNGHSAEIKFRVQDQPNVKGGGLPDVYVLDHLHFHWQSEHTINGYRYPLELHLVHYANRYNNLSEALRYKDGVAVFSVLFDLSPDDEGEFEPLIGIIEKLQDKVNRVEPMILKMVYYLPRNTAGFYRYDGSLTTPGCTEGLIWTVFTSTLPISKNQVNSFHHMQTDEKRELLKNYRSLQDLNDRKVYLKVSPIRESASSKTHVKIILVLSLLVGSRFV